MKKIKTIIAALLILTAASSCKKENDVITPLVTTPTLPTGPKLVKYEYADGSYAQTFTYATNGRLEKATDNYYINKYSYPTASVIYEGFKTDNTKDYDLTNIVITDNKITSYDFRLFNHNTGLPNTPQLNTLQYDANGYLVKKMYGGYTYDYTIANGNTINMKATTNFSASTKNMTLEYYTDKPNKLNISLFEEWYLGQYLFDNELHGKKNTNLLKKTIYTYGTTTDVTEFSYVMNADGLPAQMTSTRTVNSGAPVVTTTNFTYQ